MATENSPTANAKTTYEKIDVSSKERPLSPKAIKFTKGATKALIIPTVAWEAALVAGGITLAVTTGGVGLAVLGAAAALVGAHGAYSALRIGSKADSIVDDTVAGKTPAILNTGTFKIMKNPVVVLATGAVLLGAGIALVAGTGGAILPLALGAALIASGGVGTLSGAVTTAVGGVKLAAKGVKSLSAKFSRKKKVAAVNDNAAQKPAAPQSAPEAASTLGDKSAAPEFTAAAKGRAPEQAPATPAAKPAAAAPKAPKAA